MAQEYTFEIPQTDGSRKKYSFGPETLHVQQQCKLAYTQAYAFYFKNGAMTRAQALDIAKVNGVIDDEWQKRVDLIVMQITMDTGKLTEARSKKRKNKKLIDNLTASLKKSRGIYENLLARHTEIMLPTCENLSENRELELCVVMRLLDEDGVLVFKDHADMVNKYDEPITQITLEHMMYLRSGLPYQLEGLYVEDQKD